MFSLQGKRALIVGGTSGIGLAAAHIFKEAGADVTVASRSPERVALARKDFGLTSEVLDAASDDQVERFLCEHGTWDHIVVSVSVEEKGHIRNMIMRDAYDAMNAKFWSAFRIARSARFNEGGSLTIVSGQVGKRPRADAVLLAGINAGLEGLVRGLAVDLSPLRVNAVSPGPTDTPQHDRFPAELRRELYQKAAQVLPAKRIGAASDIGEAILYLACNKFTTGATLRIDGGSTVA